MPKNIKKRRWCTSFSFAFMIICVGGRGRQYWDNWTSSQPETYIEKKLQRKKKSPSLPPSPPLFGIFLVGRAALLCYTRQQVIRRFLTFLDSLSFCSSPFFASSDLVVAVATMSETYLR